MEFRSWFRFLLFALVVGSLLIWEGCRPFSTTARSEKVDWDSDLKKGKAAFLSRSPAGSGRSQPNIILMVCDDLGKHEVSTYGSANMRTPNLDQLGAEGIVFDQGYVTSATCAPSRAGILTGRMQNRFGFETQVNEVYPQNALAYRIGKKILKKTEFVITTKPPWPKEDQIRRQGLPPSEVNLAEALKHQGYATALIGKWHLGRSEYQHPNALGFDYQYGFQGASSLYTAEKEWPGIVNHEHDLQSARYQWKKGRKGSAAISENGIPKREERYLTFAIRDQAIEFIEQHQEEPFFMMCTFNAPHIPFQAPQEHVDRFNHIEDLNKRVYYGMISALDEAVGSIHQRVKDLGMEENTLIVFLSDNGGALYTEATDNGPLKGGKFTHFEGGVNIPYLMKWKGRIPAGQRFGQPVSSTDIFPTALVAAGGRLPSDRTYDGVDLLPYLDGRNQKAPHPRLIWRADHIWAMRKGEYKLILSTRDKWLEFYNLSDDPYEATNLKEQLPEMVKAFCEEHLEWQQELPEQFLWKPLVDYHVTINGLEYFFPS